MSKGDNRRPGDDQAFADNYAQIFGDRKPIRGSFVYDETQGKMVPKEEYVPELKSAMVMTDIQPYKSMATGELITSRSTHREHLKKHRLIEVGNETKYISQRSEPKPLPGLKRTIAEIVNAKLK